MPTPEKVHLLSELVRKHQQLAAVDLTIPRIDRTGPLQLSFGQERLWFLDQLAPGNPFYNDCEAFRLEGPLDAVALERALQQIVARHEILRTGFPSIDGEPVQCICEDVEVRCPLDDISAIQANLQPARTLEIARRDLMCPFDLEQAPLVRFRLIRNSDRDHLLLLTLHHIVFDGWSLGVFAQELAAFYAADLTGTPARLPELRIQFCDFAAWQRRRVTGPLEQRQLDYWRRRLAEPRSRLELPTDFPRPAEPTFRGDSVPVDISDKLTAALGQLARRENTTLFAVLLAVYKILLHATSGEEDIVIGTPVANRNHRDLEPLLGFILNTLALRTRLSANVGIREVLRRVAETSAEACDNQDIPFEKLVAELNPQRRLNQHPLFQVWFCLITAPPPVSTSSGLEIRFADIESESARFDLALILWHERDRLRGYFEYSCDLYERATVSAYADRYLALLERVVNRPEASVGDLIGTVERQIEEKERAGLQERKENQAKKLALLRRRTTRAGITPSNE